MYKQRTAFLLITAISSVNIAVAQQSNPFDFDTVKKNIENSLKEYDGKFEIMKVPNITNVCYGRGVGWKIEKISLPKEIEKISATKIRSKM